MQDTHWKRDCLFKPMDGLEAFEALGLSGSFDFQVLSPARLFSRAFEAAGRPPQAREPTSIKFPGAQGIPSISGR